MNLSLLSPPGHADHPLRTAVLGEIHARPFQALRAPARLLLFGFVTSPAEAAADRVALAAFCTARGAAPPGAQAKHHRAAFGDVELRWEQHSEFTTYTWQVSGQVSGQAAEDEATPFAAPLTAQASMMEALPQPGALLVSTDLHFVPFAPGIQLERLFDTSSLAASTAMAGAAIVATDFKPGRGGVVRILVMDCGLTPPRAGALAQRLLEIETYRLFALLGLPEAQRLSPRINQAEAMLARITSETTGATDLSADHRLLGQLTQIAAQLEADTAASNFRFGASRAYDLIVGQRLEAIEEGPHDAYPAITSFLRRRMQPAMRTCQMLEQRQESLANKLMRAANLLRTRVDVEIEQQNRDLLESMNERTRMQLRLQQTVEGLSVAAISYYIVGLAAYVLKGIKDLGYGPDTSVSTAIAVPLVIVGVALVVRRIRRGHGDGKAAPARKSKLDAKSP